MFGINTVLKNEAVTNQTLSNADSSNSFDKISNTTAWNPAPNHDRASVVFKR